MGILISANITLLVTVYRSDWFTLTSNCLFAIQSVLSIIPKSPVKKLLVSIDQPNSGNLIHFYYKLFGRAKEVKIYSIRSRRPHL